MLTRRNFMHVTGAAAMAAPAIITGAQRPNILFIGTDDLRCELNCYGREHIHSPNIDGLAESGMLFRSAYVQQAVCAASRASLLSGCRPDTTGVNYPYSVWYVQEFLQQYPSISRFFYEHGWYTRTIGKVHHGHAEHFSEKHDSGSRPNYYALEENIRKGGQRGRSNETPPFEAADVPDNGYKDGRNTDEAIATLRRAAKHDQPFCLTVGYFKPHLPFCAPKKYWDLYRREDIPLSPNPLRNTDVPDYSVKPHELASYSGPHDKDGAILPNDRARTLRHAYFACVSYIDAQIGRLLTELDRLGQRDNTIIMFWSDHGWHLGDHGIWGKETTYERATHAPLIVSAPGMTNAGQDCSALVEYVDMFPTLAELAGEVPPDHLEGTSMTPLLENPARAWKKAAFSQFPRGDKEGYAMRTPRYRYVEWRETERNIPGKLLDRELYDHQTNPEESRNLAHMPEYSELLKQLEQQKAKGWKSALPPGISNLSDHPIAPPSERWGQ
jgi:iduronate 2-sulfatase